MTCAACRHSIGSPDGLLCTLKARPAIVPCRAFEYEPGADAGERGGPDA